MRTTIRRMSVMVALVALIATSCGGTPEPPAAEVSAALDTATANIANLQTSENLLETQMLNVSDGEIVSLADVVTGDRAVLLWYWAPH